MSKQVTPAIADLLADQRERWARGDRATAEFYLREHPPLAADSECLLDLIYQEVFLRECNGERPRREEYLRRFPRLAAAIADQFDVHQVIETGPPDQANIGCPTVSGLELLKEIGHGAMGRVFKARHLDSGAIVAVKVLSAKHFSERAFRKRFLAEARAAAVLDHPNIVKLFEVNECPSGPYFVMELIEGKCLESIVRDGPMAPAQAIQWVTPIAEAIHYAHGQGIIHRDLKPANILLDADGRPRVMDFGMAKILRGADIAGPSSTLRGTILGTPSYMPPEQAGDLEIAPGPPNDIYSLGAILYALLTGRPPFDEGNFVSTIIKVRSGDPAPPVRSLRPDVPILLEQICHRCLHKRAAERYQTAHELAEALASCHEPQAPPLVAAPVSLCSLTTGEVFPLLKEITVVGRAAECDLVLKTPDVSRRHCQLIRAAGQVLLEDLGSLRGTLVNDTRVTRMRLNHGDRLTIASHLFTVRVRNTED